MDPYTPKAAARIWAVTAGVVGGTSLLLLGVFVVVGPFEVVNLKLGTAPALLLDGGLSLAFFVQHSVMIRPGFKKRIARVFPEHTHGVIYTFASGLLLVALVWWWQPVPPVVVDVPVPLRWVLRGLVPAGVGVLIWAAGSLKQFDPFGARAMLDGPTGASAGPPRLIVEGAYRWVRHPFYLAMLMILWSYPDLTADRLLFNFLWTSWVVLGAYLEERDLARAFGQPYRDYQRRVPMLFPWRIPRG